MDHTGAADSAADNAGDGADSNASGPAGGDSRAGGNRAALSGPVEANVVGAPGGSGSVWEFIGHPDLRTALRWVLEQFDHSRAVTGYLRTAHAPHLFGGRTYGVRLVRVSDTRVLVVPDWDEAASAQAVVDLMPCRGYHPVVLPGATPLAALRPHLSTRVFNSLAREQFTTVEQVAAMPDAALLDIRLMGEPSIATIRHAIAAVHAPRLPTGGVRLDDDQVRELAALLNMLSVYAAGRGSHHIAERVSAFLHSITDPTAPPAAPPGDGAASTPADEAGPRRRARAGPPAAAADTGADTAAGAAPRGRRRR